MVRNLCIALLILLGVSAAACSAYDPEKLSPGGTTPQAGGSGRSQAGSAGAGSGSGGAGASAGIGGSGGRANPPPIAGSTAMDAAVPDAHLPLDGSLLDAEPMESGVDATVDAGCSAGNDCCPNDPDKIEPGMCGCDVADGDRDTDGTPDCHDLCPDDPNKTEPGMCECGNPDTDSDSDGTADCDDLCRDDAAKTAPGICGCGRIDADNGTTISCSGLVSALLHRYRFDGTGPTVTDSKGDADGMARNVTLSNTGSLTLAGGSSDEYVDLPNGIASALTNATFEAFVTWDGGSAWQRIFDFGNNSSSTEGNQGSSGRTYLFVTPRAATSSTVLRVVYSDNGASNEITIDGDAALPTGGMHQVVVVVDDAADQLRLFLDGALVDQVPFSKQLSALTDINNWFGRSQFSVDPDFDGTLHEFRIYGAALTAGQIALSNTDGPDPAYLP